MARAKAAGSGTLFQRSLTGCVWKFSLRFMAGRKTLRHNPPWWVDPTREIWFLTVSCRPRTVNQLANEPTFQALAESVEFRVQQGIWFPHVFLALPDHCHLLVQFPHDERGMKTVIPEWKRWTARSAGINWQLDFFDHRLRRDESYEEKMRYVLENPARGGLVRSSEEWTYRWLPSQQLFTGLHR